MIIGKLAKERIKLIAATSARIAMFIARSRALVDAVISMRRRLLRFPSVYFGPNVKLVGIARIRIGRNTAIGAGSWLNVNALGQSEDALVIGENCFIGRDTFMTVGSSIRVGDYCLSARGCAFLGSSHIYSDPTVPYLLTGTTEDGNIVIGANCFFGYAARIVGDVRIGHGSVIGACAEVRDDVPPFSLVVGQPARVIKRYDFGSRKWVRWPTEEYIEGPNEADFLQQLRKDKRWFVMPLAAAAGAHFDVP